MTRIEQIQPRIKELQQLRVKEAVIDMKTITLLLRIAEAAQKWDTANEAMMNTTTGTAQELSSLRMNAAKTDLALHEALQDKPK